MAFLKQNIEFLIYVKKEHFFLFLPVFYQYSLISELVPGSFISLSAICEQSKSPILQDDSSVIC